MAKVNRYAHCHEAVVDLAFMCTGAIGGGLLRSVSVGQCFLVRLFTVGVRKGFM